MVSLLGRLWRDYMGRYWPKLVLAFFFMVVLALAEAGYALSTEWVFSAFGQESGRFHATAQKIMFIGPLILFGLGTLNALALFFQALLSQGVAIAVLRDLQKAMFAKFLQYDFAQAREDGTGQLVSRFTNDMTVLRESLTRAPNALRDGVRLVTLLGLMIYFDWVLFLVILIIYPTIGLPITLIGKRLRRLAQSVQNQIGGMTGLLNESMAGARMVKTYQLESYEQARADAAFDERHDLLAKFIRYRAANEPLITLIGAFAVAIVIGVAAWRIVNGALDSAGLIGFIVTLAMLSQPARGLGTLNAVLQEGVAALARIFWVIDRDPEIKDAKQAKPLQWSQGQPPAIRFEGVSFSYDGETKALDDFSLSIPPGKIVALVGESGAGKSTLFNLLPRLYDIQSGSIHIGKQNIEQVTLESLRRAMALVSQEAILFEDSIANNIRFGDPEASQEAIEQAAKAAAADEFIKTFPHGYDNNVGEGGGSLSGGQRQRLSLARAFLKDAPILLLDEATSALDAESEARVQEALQRLTKGRTTLIIAHRLATVRMADCICVLDKGKLVEQGSHDELMAKDGLYARLARLQFRDLNS